MVHLVRMIVVIQVIGAVQSQNEAASLVEKFACQSRQTGDLSCEVTCKEAGSNRIAFNAILDNSYTSFSWGDIVKYDDVTLNLGNGYDSSTGLFTVPEGGEGLYHFAMFYRTESATYVYLSIYVNGSRKCGAETDDNNSPGDSGSGGCSITIYLIKDDKVNVVYSEGTDGRSLYFSNGKYNGFNGFRIN